jgi:dTDP-4-dehydrorhamnose reductase
MIMLVIGRDGQLARSLAELRPGGDLKIVTVGRPVVDLLHPDSLMPAIDHVRPDVVVNAAAYTAVDKAESETELAYAVNGEGPGHVGAACAERGVPVIHLSTDYVYDGAKPTPYVESDPVSPINAYGRSKLAGEQKLAAANPRHIILRTAWVHAPFGHNFVKTMLRLGATRPELSVVDDQRGNPTYAPHLAAAVAAIAPQIRSAPANDTRWGIYHAVGGGETTWFGLAREVFACAEGTLPTPRLKAISTAEYPTPAGRPANSRLDTAKLEQTFGVTLPPWTDGVAACVAVIAAADGGSLQRG